MDQPLASSGLYPPHMREPFTPPPHRATNMEDLSLCASSGDVEASPGKRKKQGEPESLWGMLRRGIVDHQLGLSVNLILFVGMSYVLFPSLRSRMSAFFGLSYASATQSGMYGQGTRDMYLVASFIVVFTALRAFALDFLLLPLAGWCRIDKKKGKVRFAEQFYMMVYYILYWGWGALLFVRDTPSDVRDVEDLLISLWGGFPRLLLDTGMKLYYLSQFAFWIQQIVVLHIEERRKDHFQMLTHHIITVSLLAGSYTYRQNRAGNAVLVCMDIVDFIFPLAKILKYLAWQRACDAAFALFVIFWFLSRHVAYCAICWSIYAHVNNGTMSTSTGAKLSDDGGTNIIDNLLQPMLHPEAQTLSFNANIRWLFLGLLLALQCITIAWFVMICRVVMRVLRGEGADDSRSEAEDTDIDQYDEARKDDTGVQTSAQQERPRYIEIETTSEELRTYPKRGGGSTGSGSKRKGKAISSGLHLGEHKDILNRIGCLSEEQLAREKEKREGSASPGFRPGSAGAAAAKK
ncbi:Sphingosine N-acyltransferase lag1 [Friedmanniomyces endolithicus]|nr:Sphingosine N-acyltransferase lag1 [Friedmanniomyces endolithicus]KAK0844288.1 Sphingosine N-acyltransferase lag1 [Friedmanniomyces endolithicus]KAK0911826.1 Sphingosine N-acyltransferase lag1 [Friedmanniomyces endolithicus]KAK0921679.1 Sphingosine N-acyltransferase lag1 [Friedmanniomyces endolithicus]KAK0999134.1 Sphingosine N-acyltransferase lag1 [Friedmanniomyces endolithicus]